MDRIVLAKKLLRLAQAVVKEKPKQKDWESYQWTKEEWEEYKKEHPATTIKPKFKQTEEAPKEAPEDVKHRVKQKVKEKIQEKVKEKIKPEEGKKEPVAELFTEEEEALPAKAKQPKVHSEDELYQQADEAQNHMMKWLNMAQGLDKKLGLKHYDASKGLPDLNEPGRVLITAPKKGKERAKEKVEADYGGDWSRLTDVVRASIAVDSFDEIGEVMGELRKSGMKLAKKPKNRFANPTTEGYRDIMMNVEFPNGHIGELQVHVKPMLEAKSKAHKLYEVSRGLSAKAKKEGRSDMTPEEWDEFKKVRQQQQQIYNGAWQKATGAKTVAAFLRDILAEKSTEYFDLDGNPAILKKRKYPVMLVNGKEVVQYDLFKFIHNADPISKSEYNKMVREQGKKASNVRVARELLRIARCLLAFQPRGYGVWIKADGKPLFVPYQGHFDVAWAYWGKKKPENVYLIGDPYPAAYEGGWARVMFDGKQLNFDISKHTTRKAKEALEDLIFFGGFKKFAGWNVTLKRDVFTEEPEEAIEFIKRA